MQKPRLELECLLKPWSDLRQGSVTQARLATSEDELARSTGGYFYHQRSRAPNRIANDVGIQEELLAECGRISSIPLTN